MIASANYVINEWLDARFDKYHPTKKKRPVVQNTMSGKIVAAEYAVLAAVGLGASLLVNIPFFVCELWLLVMGVLYNVKPFRTKDIAYLDVLSESINNAIRLLLGWFFVTADYLPPVTIVLGYWLGGAFLMAIKRYAEYRMIGDKSTAALYRPTCTTSKWAMQRSGAWGVVAAAAQPVKSAKLRAAAGTSFSGSASMAANRSSMWRRSASGRALAFGASIRWSR